MAAARHWARGGAVQDGAAVDAEQLGELLADLRAFGAAEADLRALEAGAAEGAEVAAFPVWPENWLGVELFLGCQTQWRLHVAAGMAGGAVIWQGLDYPAVRAAHEMRGGAWDAELFADIQAMEAAALPILNARRDGGRDQGLRR